MASGVLTALDGLVVREDKYIFGGASGELLEYGVDTEYEIGRARAASRLSSMRMFGTLHQALLTRM